MKSMFLKLGVFLTAAMNLVGNAHGNDSRNQKITKEISEETPLYLDEASQALPNADTNNLFAWHSSHVSHSSHQSHFSHYSGR